MRRLADPAVRHPPGTMVTMAWSTNTSAEDPLVSHTGAVLSRPVAFGFALDVRFTSPRSLVVPKLGELRICGSAKKVVRMVAALRFHVYSASFGYSAGRWFVRPSCTRRAQLSLSTRVYTGEHCGLELDRDRNAAINLARWPARRAARAPLTIAAA